MFQLAALLGRGERLLPGWTPLDDATDDVLQLADGDIAFDELLGRGYTRGICCSQLAAAEQRAVPAAHSKAVRSAALEVTAAAVEAIVGSC